VLVLFKSGQANASRWTPAALIFVPKRAQSGYDGDVYPAGIMDNDET
jgi:hypothetical protein